MSVMAKFNDHPISCSSVLMTAKYWPFSKQKYRCLWGCFISMVFMVNISLLSMGQTKLLIRISIKINHSQKQREHILIPVSTPTGHYSLVWRTLDTGHKDQDTLLKFAVQSYLAVSVSNSMFHVLCLQASWE